MNTLIKREYDYALRICAYLAGKYEQGLTSISRLAQLLFLSRPFTTKIVFQLKNEHIVTTVQGKDGGVYLTNDPKDVSVYDVLRAMGYDSRLNECLAEGHQCPMEGICRLHVFFDQQEALLMNNLKEKKLSELIISDAQLKKTVRQTME
jgi:Rrf2 family transcriptional regulator, nitric oxide-sensitive transcriptional repressor